MCLARGWRRDPTQCLFPNLSCLEAEWDGYLPYLPHEKLVSLGLLATEEISSSYEANILEEALQTVIERSCHIQRLFLQVQFEMGPPEDASPTFTYFTRAIVNVGLPDLRYFQCNIRLSAHDISALGSLPALEHLTLTLLTEAVLFDNPLTILPPRSLFPVLQVLEMTSKDISNGCKVVGSIASMQLRILSVICAGQFTTSSSLAIFFHGIQHLHCLKTISVKCELFDEDVDDVDLADRTIFPVTLQPLLSLRGLTDVHIDTPLTLSLNDQLISDAAKAWPSLRKLTIQSEAVSHRYRPELTLGGLLPLAEYCPQLIRLSLPMDLDLPSEDIQQKTRQLRKRQVHLLERIDATFTCEVVHPNVDELANFVMELFPSLRKFVTRSGLFKEDHDVAEPTWRLLLAALEQKTQ